MDLRHLRTFCVLGEELHFGRASRRLGVVQPAVSRTLSSLESYLGVVLLERSPKKVVLTKAGESFLRHARSVLTLADEAVRAARLGEFAEPGELNLGMMISAAQPKVGLLLARFSAKYPGVRIRLLRAEERSVGKLLIDGVADAIVAWDPSIPAGCGRRQVSNTELAILVPTHHRLASRKQISLADLAEEAIIIPARDAQPIVYQYFRALCQQHGFEPRIAIDVDNLSEVFPLVAAGVGIGNAPVCTGQSYPGVVIIRQDPPVHASYSLIWTQKSPTVERLLTCLDELDQSQEK